MFCEGVVFGQHSFVFCDEEHCDSLAEVPYIKFNELINLDLYLFKKLKNVLTFKVITNIAIIAAAVINVNFPNAILL